METILKRKAGGKIMLHKNPPKVCLMGPDALTFGTNDARTRSEQSVFRAKRSIFIFTIATMRPDLTLEK
jgi:hypothetical protein